MAEPAPHLTEIAPGVALPDAALSFTFSRSGGPGGQNVNKLNTRATLTVDGESLCDAMPADAVRRLKAQAARYVTQEGLQISCADSRSQAANRRVCMDRLRAVIVEAMRRPKVRKPTRPSARARQRRLDAKKQRSQIKATRRNRPD